MQTTTPKLSSFVRLDAAEAFERDYYITHSSKWRFTLGVLFMIVGVGLGGMALGAAITFAIFRKDLPIFIGLGLSCLPGLVALLYYCFRRLRISHGYAAITNRRILYYEYNTHPAENYQHVKSLHLDDVTGIDFQVDRTWFSKSIFLVVYTSKKGMVVGAKGFLGWLNIFGNESHLEPGPEALEFIQFLTGAITARQLESGSGSGRMAH